MQNKTYGGHEMEPKDVNRLLCIVSSMDRGGAETFLMKVYRTLDKTKYQMDFCVNKAGAYDEEIKKMGGKVFIIPPKSKHPLKSFSGLKKIIKENKYQSVLRTSQQSLAVLDLLVAKVAGAKKLIYRSSNAGVTGGFFSRFFNRLFGFLPRIIPNVKLAPSTEAAEFVFGKKAVKNGKVQIIHNGLDYKLFEFNEETRNEIRKKLHLENKMIIGHVGRFNAQKNHEFLIDIFNEIHKVNDRAHLLMIGKGELEEKIKNKIQMLELNDYVTIIPPISNVNEYYMAMDVLVFPSFFEGMPNVIIEAQATGLECYVSDTITKEANITENIKNIELNKSAKEWANQILQKKNIQRKGCKQAYIQKKYMIEQVCENFIKNCYY